MKRYVRTIFVASGVTVALAAAGLLVFPKFAKAQSHVKDGPAQQLLSRRKDQHLHEMRRQLQLTMKTGSVDNVMAVWNGYHPFGGFGWNAFDQLNMGGYLLHKGRLHEARKFLEEVINPPKNSTNTMRLEGHVYVLWFQAAKDASFAERSAMLDQMAKVLKPVKGLTGMALAEYLYGQELMTFGATREAVKHYRQAVSLAPSNPLAHEALGSHLMEIGLKDEGKREYLEAYRLAPAGEERENMRRITGLSKQDVASIDHP